MRHCLDVPHILAWALPRRDHQVASNCPTRLPTTGPNTDSYAACRCEGSLKARFVATKSVYLDNLRKNQLPFFRSFWHLCASANEQSAQVSGWMGQRRSMLIPDRTPLSPYRFTQTSLAYLQTHCESCFALFCLSERQEMDIEATAKTMTVSTGNESYCVVKRVNYSNFYLFLLF